VCEVSTVGLDIAKSVFQIHNVDAAGAVVMRKRITRAKLFEFFAALPPGLAKKGRCERPSHVAPYDQGHGCRRPSKPR
jgi:transposase